MRVARLFMAAFIASAFVHAAEDSYAVKLDRPTKVGNRYRIDAKGKNVGVLTITVGEKVAQKDETDLDVRIVASVTVMAVDGKSQATRSEYLVESCEGTSSGKPQTFVAKGSRIVAERSGGKTVYTIDGKPSSDEAATALQVVISAHDPDAAMNDDVFGSAGRKRVGDEWGINAEPAVRDFLRRKVEIKPSDLVGSSRLNGVRMVGKVKALDLSLKMHCDKFKMPLPGMEIEKGSIDVEVAHLVPADPQSQELLPGRMRLQMNLRAKGQKPDTGEQFAVESTMNTTLERSYPAIKDSPAR